MKDEDRRILAEACGLCWHEIIENPEFMDKPWTGMYLCSCEKWVSIGDRSEHYNPTFTTPDDWELVRTKVIIPNFNEFVAYIWKGQVDYTGGVHDAFAYWLTLSPEECCQLAADFLRKEKG